MHPGKMRPVTLRKFVIDSFAGSFAWRPGGGQGWGCNRRSEHVRNHSRNLNFLNDFRVPSETFEVEKKNLQIIISKIRGFQLTIERLKLGK